MVDITYDTYPFINVFDTWYIEASEPKWVNPVLISFGLTHLDFGDLHISSLLWSLIKHIAIVQPKSVTANLI